MVFLDCKGWGLYKQGNYEEALNILKKAYELDVNPVHRVTVSLHIQEVEKAIASQKE